MQKEFYEYCLCSPVIYSFTSRGKKLISKMAGFSPTAEKHMYILWLGDHLPDGLDDMSISDNGDMPKVMATVIQIIKSFTNSQPQITVAFKGNNQKRMLLYERILKNYY